MEVKAKTRISMETFDRTVFSSFARIEEHISVRLVNRPHYAGGLKLRPHKLMGDLALVYQIELKNYVGKDATVPVTNEMQIVWDVPEEEIYQAGERNTPRLNPLMIKTMEKALNLPEGAAPDIYIVSNEACYFGAGAVLYPGVEGCLKGMLGEFVIIPSSVHEVLAISASVADGKELSEMIRAINAAQVPPEEVLSDHAYRLRSGTLLTIE